MSKNDKKKKEREEEETIEEMNDFSEDTKKNRFHQKKDKVYVVNKMKEKAQRVDEEGDVERSKKHKEEEKHKDENEEENSDDK